MIEMVIVGGGVSHRRGARIRALEDVVGQEQVMTVETKPLIQKGLLSGPSNYCHQNLI